MSYSVSGLQRLGFAVGTLVLSACAGDSTPPTWVQEHSGPPKVVYCPSCELREPDNGDWQRIIAAIGHISTADPGCDAIHEAAWMESFAIYAFDDYPDAYADHHSSGAYGDQTHISDVNMSNPQELAYTLIHEMAHHLGENETMADWYMTACYVE